jgi:hypothetical protein
MNVCGLYRIGIQCQPPTSSSQIIEFKRLKLSAVSPPPASLPTSVAINLNSGGVASGKRLMAALLAAGAVEE